MNYYISVTCNNGSTTIISKEPYTNKRKALNHCHELILGNHFQGYTNCSRYAVYDEDGRLIYRGSYQWNQWHKLEV